MALMLDGKMSTVADIIQQDSGCLEVSEAEAISIDGKLALADRDCRLKLAQFVVNQVLEDVLGAAGNLLRLTASLRMRRWSGGTNSTRSRCCIRTRITGA